MRSLRLGPFVLVTAAFVAACEFGGGGGGGGDDDDDQAIDAAVADSAPADASNEVDAQGSVTDARIDGFGIPGFDGGLPGFDGGLPGFDGGLPGFDGGIPGFDGGIPGFDGGLPF